MYELIDAWTLWFSGKLDDLYVLWGIEILWWGRIGKFLQTVALITIIIEIIGPEKLKLFGNSLHSLYSTKSAKTWILDAFSYQRVWLKYMFSFGGKRADEAIRESGNFKTNILNITLLSIVYVVLVFLAWEENQWFAFIRALATTFTFGFVSGLVCFVLIFFISFIGFFIDMIVIEPMAWIMSHEHADKLIKLYTLLIAVIGIHFDFLAS